MIVGDRVIATTTPWMAGKQALDCQETALENAETLDCFYRVLRAGRGKTAIAAQQRADRVLVKTDW